MQIINSGNASYVRFLSSAPEPDKIYYPSSYLLKQKADDGLLLCNTVTGMLCFLSPEEEKLFCQAPLKADTQITELIQYRFLIPVSNQEDQIIAQLRELFIRRQETKGEVFNYNILPTTGCNARCFYCYESGIKPCFMTRETADKLIAFIADHHGKHKVKLAWFGGEPTLAINRINQICKGLEDLGIEYESEMTSNAYLFDTETIKLAKGLWRLKKIQITIDGTEKIYNQTKAYINANDNPYQHIIENIEQLNNEKIKVEIRLNLGRHNERDLFGLIDELSELFPDRSWLTMYASKLDYGIGYKLEQISEEDLESLDQTLEELQEYLEKKGWKQWRATKLPQMKICSCMADDPSSIQCTPDGILSKCENDIYEHTVGTLDSGIEKKDEISWWRQRRDFDRCNECPIYPSCIRLLKNCPVKTSKCLEFEKRNIIARYKEVMLQEYEAWKNRQDAP